MIAGLLLMMAWPIASDWWKHRAPSDDQSGRTSAALDSAALDVASLQLTSAIASQDQESGAGSSRQDSTISISNLDASDTLSSDDPDSESASDATDSDDQQAAAAVPGKSVWNPQTIHRLLALLVGVAIVLFGIIGLKLNAFLALIVAALVVSLMGPGEWTGKIARVGAEFGSSAGKVGLAIALAAVIGQSLMASGAAERIVDFFMKMLGEKRTPLALCGSGYALGIPVFFDTVFYLLVPLARSMYLKTRSRYLAGLLAIAAGGAITHTLVPPTPGPLLVASNLGVNLGMMMMVGSVVAAVSAVAGLTFASLADRYIKIPIRWLDDPNTDQEAQHTHDQRSLPPLYLAALPLGLPVVMIATSALFGTLADNEERAKFTADQPADFSRLTASLSEPDATLAASDLTTAQAGPDVSSSDWIVDSQTVLSANKVRIHLLSQPALNTDELRLAIKQLSADDKNAEAAQTVATALNKVLASRDFYSDEPFLGLRLSKPTKKLLAQSRSKMPMAQLQRLNRLLIEDGMPGLTQPHQWQTQLRTAADWAGVFGDPNLALLLAAVIALLIEKRQRKVGWASLGMEVEKALASAGVIILITAAGGAFGAMLQEAKVGEAIREVFSQYSETGLGLLVLSFAIASVLKFAQGSSTVAMITASGMLASVATPDTLGCHPVYMATAIGGGSLVGSWMNDSGFWIFTKMGYLTSIEGLKTWTPCLAILGLTAGLTTLLMAWLLPLV